MPDAAQLDATSAALDVVDRLKALRDSVEGRIVSRRASAEDQYLTHLIFDNKIAIDVVTLDTGPHVPADLRSGRRRKKSILKRIRPHYPDASALEALVADQASTASTTASMRARPAAACARSIR